MAPSRRSQLPIATTPKMMWWLTRGDSPSSVQRTGGVGGIYFRSGRTGKRALTTGTDAEASSSQSRKRRYLPAALRCPRQLIVLCPVIRAAAPVFAPRANPKAQANKAARAWLERKHTGQGTSMAKLYVAFNVKSTRSVMLAKDEMIRSGAATVLVAALTAITAPVQPSELDLPLPERRIAAQSQD